MTIQMEDILANRVPIPWTYASFVAYLSDNYCLEILQFALAAAQYKERYDFVSSIPGRRVSLPSQESQDLLVLWTSLVETYLLPDGEREVNLPSQIRDPIIGYTLEQRAADPQVLESAILATWELMEGLILSSYVSEVSPQSCLPVESQPSGRFERPKIHAGSRRARVVDILHSSRPRVRKIIISLFDLFARHHVSRSREYTRRFSH